MRHDGKPDLPEPWKQIVWEMGRFTAVVRGTSEALRRLSELLADDEK